MTEFYFFGCTIPLRLEVMPVTQESVECFKALFTFSHNVYRQQSECFICKKTVL